MIYALVNPVYMNVMVHSLTETVVFALGASYVTMFTLGTDHDCNRVGSDPYPQLEENSIFVYISGIYYDIYSDFTCSAGEEDPVGANSAQRC